MAFTVTQINMADETDSKDAVEIVEEFVFESLSPEEIEVFNLLSEFEVQAEVISAFISKYSLFVKRISSDPFFFKANRYTLSTLRIIERPEVEALVQPPFLAERTKIIAGLSNWRISQVKNILNCFFVNNNPKNIFSGTSSVDDRSDSSSGQSGNDGTNRCRPRAVHGHLPAHELPKRQIDN